MPATVGRSRCFLNRFQCEPSNHVLAFSGEADKWEVRQRIEAIFESKSLELRSGNRRRQPTSDQSVNSLNLTLYFNAPRMALAEDKRIVRDEIRRHGADVVIFDPLYLCALSGTNVNAGSVFEMGEILQAMEDVVKDEHATPVFLHHFVKSVKPGIEPTLGHMAFAGAAERAAQWMLLNHRVPFDATNGHARLIMDVGGRAGQGGVYGVDIVEGRLNEDFTGRGWQVEVMGLDEARTRDRDQGFSRRSGQQSSGGLIRLRQRMLQHLSDRDEAVCLSPLARELHANHSNCRDIVQQLRSERLVEVVPAYNGRDGFRLTDAGREAASSTAVSDNGLSVMDGDGD
jgi:hypothetical protein